MSAVQCCEGVGLCPTSYGMCMKKSSPQWRGHGGGFFLVVVNNNSNCDH